MSSTAKNLHGGRAVDPSHLEMLGKQAARIAETSGLSLSDAVVQQIGHEKLNAEQVRRVVEFTNIEAFNRKFASLQGPMRAVQIDGGPADPQQVLQSLNNGARPQEVTIETMEYSMPPTFGKTASFRPGFTPVERTREGSIGDVLRLQSKLAAAHDEVTQSTEAASYNLRVILGELGDRVKRASLQGATSREIFEAWHRVDPEMAKIAFSRAKLTMPKDDGTKVAGRRINPDHPVVTAFGEFVKVAQAYGGYVAARQSIEEQLSKVERWLAKHGG